MLEIKNASYKYNKVLEESAISGINIRVKKGECVLLCGRSGSGKTTLTKLINSLIPNYYESGELSGEILVDGTDTASSEIYEVSRIVSSVFQNPKTQFFNVNTTSEILFYLENRGFSREYMKEKLAETAELFSISHLFDRDIFELSGGEKQIIAIAAAYASGTDIILLDEPSANLDEEKTRLIGEILAKIKAQGKTIIISEHRFYYVADIIDRVYYIDKGEIKKEYSKDEFFSISDEKRKELGLRDLHFEKLDKDKNSAGEDANVKKLTIQNLEYKFTGQNRGLDIKDRSFDFGRVVGVYGKNGLGKSTFIKILMGLIRCKNADIMLDGEKLSDRKRLGMSYLVMQDVNHQLFTDSVETELLLGMAKYFSDEDLEKVLKALNIYELKDRHPMSLSGGQKQRVAIASALLSGSKIICFDEPTSGMDYDNMMKISVLIKEMINDEIIIFIISHDHEFLNETADEIMDMGEYKLGCGESNFYCL